VFDVPADSWNILLDGLHRAYWQASRGHHYMGHLYRIPNFFFVDGGMSRSRSPFSSQTSSGGCCRLAVERSSKNISTSKGEVWPRMPSSCGRFRSCVSMILALKCNYLDSCNLLLTIIYSGNKTAVLGLERQLAREIFVGLECLWQWFPFVSGMQSFYTCCLRSL
jgi:hypothetical protein